MTMTVKELTRLYDLTTHCKKGYCCEYEAPNGKYSLVEYGYNSGVYGWNWTAYKDIENDTLYISYYRNVPNYIKEK